MKEKKKDCESSDSQSVVTWDRRETETVSLRVNICADSWAPVSPVCTAGTR